MATQNQVNRDGHYTLHEGRVFGDTRSIGCFPGAEVHHIGFGDFSCRPWPCVAGEVRWERIDGTPLGDRLIKAGFIGRPHEIRVTPRELLPEVAAMLQVLGLTEVKIEDT